MTFTYGCKVHHQTFLYTVWNRSILHPKYIEVHDEPVTMGKESLMSCKQTHMTGDGGQNYL